jgi:ribosomal protein S17
VENIMIKFLKEDESTITAWNDKTHKAADIVRIYEYNPLGKEKVRWRIDFEGKTVLSMATLTECKAKARKILK